MLNLGEFSKEFEKYLSEILSIFKREDLDKHKRESQKMHIFMKFVETVAGLKPEEYSYDTFIIKGRPDAVVGNLIIEFEDDLRLESEKREAEKQLEKYAKELKEKFGTNKFYGLATDGIRFILYEIVIEKNKIKLEKVDDFEVSSRDIKRFYYFIFLYFFSNRFIKKLTPENIVGVFGYNSPIFKETFRILKKYWEQVKNKTNVKTLFDQWAKYYTYVTGEELRDEDLFLRHTYLALLTKFLVYFFLKETKSKLGNIKELEKVITGEIFKKDGLEIFDKDFYSWILDEEIKEDLLWELHDVLLKELLSFDFSELTTDILKEIYQNIIERDERAALGEYYTPDFIAEKIVRELLEKRPEAKILDPACGSGTFLFIAIKIKKEKLKKRMSKEELVNHILKSVVGIDINPVAVIMARANYLLAIKDLLPIAGTLRIPVYLANALILQTRTEKDPNINIPVFRIPGLEENEYFILPADKDLLEKIGLEKLDKLVELSEELVKELGEDVMKFEVAMKLAKQLIDKTFGNVYFPDLGKFISLDEKTKDMLAYFVVKNAQLLWKYIKEGKDTFWIFVLKNTYKPLFYKEAFSFVVGNPPWVSYSDSHSEQFRRWFLELLNCYSLKFDRVYLGRADTAMLFIAHAIYFYLQKWGDVYFVVPEAFLTGYQYESFRKEEGLMKIYKIVDLTNLKINGRDIFNIKCVLVRLRKTDKKEINYIEGEVYEGNINYEIHGMKSRNVPYDIFLEHIKKGLVKVKKGRFILAGRNLLTFVEEEGETKEITKENIVQILIEVSNKKRSEYLHKVKEGGTFAPRIFIFVKIPKPEFAFNPESIYVETHPRAAERGKEGAHKGKYRSIISGYISSKYLYGVITADNVYPFGVWGINICVLPAEVDYINNKFIIYSEDLALKRLANWYDNCAKAFYGKEEISSKEKMEFMKYLLRRIKYANNFGAQKPKAWTVVYNASGDMLLVGANVINREKILEKANKSLKEQLGIDIEENILQAIIVDYTNYWLDFNSKEEAHYVCVMLQSKWIREATRQIQTKGVKGVRHITDRPFYFLIPKFSEKSEYYNWMLELAKLSEKAHEIVQPLLERYLWKEKGIPFVNNTDKYLAPASVASIRKKIRRDLEQKGIQQKIDEIAYEILKNILR